MTIRRIIFGLTAAATFSISSAALAAPAQPTAHQLKAKSFLKALDLEVGPTSLRDAHGRIDLVSNLKIDRDQLAEFFDDAHSENQALPNGFKVVGGAKLAQTGNMIYTLRANNGERMVLKLIKDGPETKVQIRDLANRGTPVKRKMTTRFSK